MSLVPKVVREAVFKMANQHPPPYCDVFAEDFRLTEESKIGLLTKVWTDVLLQGN